MPNDLVALAESLKARPSYMGWRFELWERPGPFAFVNPDAEEVVFCTPDWTEEGVICVQVVTGEGEFVEGQDIPFPTRSAAALFEHVRPWLDKYAPEGGDHGS